MNKQKLKVAALSLTTAMGLAIGAGAAQAATYAATQDTYLYEFFGNQGAPTGDSGGIMVWNHQSNHGAKALLQFDSAWATDAALSGAFTATLNLYQYCETGGFVSACAGDGPDVTTDVLLQGSAWAEDDGAIAWSDITEASTPSVSFVQTDSSNGWLSVDVTDLVLAWVNGTTDYGFALSQEAYGVSRDEGGSLTASAFCDSESSGTTCSAAGLSPYLEISAVSQVPVPAAAWLFGSAILGLVGVGRTRAVAA